MIIINKMYRAIRIDWNNFLILFVIALFSLLFSLLSPLNPFSELNPGTDSSVFLYIGHRMSVGEIPYRDIFDHKGPLLYLLNFLGMSNKGFIGVWLIELLLMQVSVSLAFYCALIVTRDKIVSTITTFIVFMPLVKYFEGGNLTEEYALPFMFVALIIYLRFLMSRSKKVPIFQIYVLGLSCGSVLMLRPNMISLWISFSLIVIIDLLLSKRYFEILQSILFFIIGISSVVVPFVNYFYINNAFTDFIDSYLIFNLKYTANNSVELLMKTFIIFWNSTYLIPLSFLFCIVGILKFIKNRSNKIKDTQIIICISSLMFLITSLLLLSVSGRQYMHYGMVLIPSFVYPTAKLLEWINFQIVYKYIKKVSFRLLINIIIVLLLTHPFILAGIQELRTNNFSNDSTEENQLSTYIKANSTIDQEIIVVGNNVSVYLLSERKASSKYIYQYPISMISENIMNEFINEIHVSKPKLIILSFSQSEDSVYRFLDSLVEEGAYVVDETKMKRYKILKRKDVY